MLTTEEEMLAASKEMYNIYGIDHSEVLTVAVSADGA